ncbi:hypothetical protein NKG05_11555 [Oerskovia sp. M15]
MTGAEGAEAVVSEVDGGYVVVAHLPVSVTEGSTLPFDVRVADGDDSSGWNTRRPWGR